MPGGGGGCDRGAGRDGLVVAVDLLEHLLERLGVVLAVVGVDRLPGLAREGGVEPALAILRDAGPAMAGAESLVLLMQDLAIVPLLGMASAIAKSLGYAERLDERLVKQFRRVQNSSMLHWMTATPLPKR